MILISLVIFALAMIVSWVLTKALYVFIQKRSANQWRTQYDIIESNDICEFLEDDFTRAIYTRVEKIQINSMEVTYITYKLPVVTSPGSIENIKCAVNKKLVNHSYEKRYGENLYGYFINPNEFNDLIEIEWKFDILNSFTSSDNIRIRSYRSLEKCLLKIIFTNSRQKVIAEAYKIFGNEDASFSKQELECTTTNKQIVIEKDFSEQLDGGIYRFGIQWKVI